MILIDSLFVKSVRSSSFPNKVYDLCMADDSAKNPVRKALGENIARIRKLRGMTVRDLSAKLDEHGLRLSASGVSEVENASRKVSVEELLVFAIALNTSVIDLLLPEIHEQMEIAKGTPTINQLSLAQWLEGRLTWPPDASREDFANAARRGRQAALMANESPALKAVSRLSSMILMGKMLDFPPDHMVQVLRESLAEVDREVNDLIADLVEEHENRKATNEALARLERSDGR